MTENCLSCGGRGCVTRINMPNKMPELFKTEVGIFSEEVIPTSFQTPCPDCINGKRWKAFIKPRSLGQIHHLYYGTQHL